MSGPDVTTVHPVTGRRPVPVLRILYPSGREEMVPLSKTPFRIGPAEDCDLRLVNGHVVEGAALIQHGPGGYLLRDLQGEVLRWNGKPVRSRVLRHGDSFEFGSPALCQISFLLPAPGSAARDLQNLKMLIEITRSVNSFCEIDDLLQKILAGALQVAGAERGMVLLAGPDGNLLLTASRDREGPAPGGPDSRPSWSIANEVFRRGRSISVRDAQTHQDFRDRTSIMALGLNTILCVPMQVQDRTLGVIYLDHRGVVENLALTDFQVVESLAATAAIAIENVRLVEAKVHSERLSAVGQMASSLVHDMRGPMTSLQGYAEMLRKHPALDERGRRYVAQILREVQRMGAMATDVLEYVRGKTTLHRAATTVGEVIDDILPLVEARLQQAGITLDVDVERDLRITVDPVKIARALLNLAANSINATPHGGRLRLAARAAPPEVRFEVADTGRGIPEGIRDRIWEPFFSHGEEHGSGLGLAIVRRVVDQHGGRIEVQTEVGRGTTIRFFLPLAPDGV